MKNKPFLITYISVGIIICLLPFVCMSFAKTDETIENRRLAELPSVKTEEGDFNLYILNELGAYFEDHFAFRPWLVSVDAEIQSKVFAVSNADSVVKGRDGWLYYSATLNDYLGRNSLSDRGIENLAYNLSLVADYVEENGSSFLLTVAPNKNSLYGEYMPYYNQYMVSERRNRDYFKSVFAQADIPYLDLFELFGSQKEILYCKRDSHWNNKGALLVYNAILDTLCVEHEDYSGAKVVIANNYYGDLNKMMYPVTGEPETNFYYDTGENYTYVTPTKSVEESWIQTQNKEGEGTLLMYRDSFGNTLLPLFSNHFENAFFSKGEPYNLAFHIETCQPDCVVIEKAERNIYNLVSSPPVIPAKRTELGLPDRDIATDTTLTVCEAQANTMYYAISGVLDRTTDCTGNIYIRVQKADSDAIYCAYRISDEDTDYGYLAYLPKEELEGYSGVRVEVIAESPDGTVNVFSQELNF